MKKVIPLFFVSLCLIILAGCQTAAPKIQQYIEVKQYHSDEHVYKTVSAHTSARDTRNFLSSLDWEEANLAKVNSPDYTLQFSNSATTVKSATYNIWLNPSKDKAEIIIDGENKHVQLDRQTSAKLFDYLIGQPLTAIK